MSIPESQLETWSHQGSIQQSAATYDAIRAVLARPDAPFAGKVDIFLQGSYGNNTNVYADSDVDIVIQYTDAFYRDLDLLPPEQKAAYHASFPTIHDYNFSSFRADVLAVLRGAFGNFVTSSNKAIKVAASGGRRSADVVPSFDFRRYTQFLDMQHEAHTPGMTFWTQSTNAQVINYPKLHRDHMTTKHQKTASVFKPTVRIYKNLRNMLDSAGAIQRNIAPSYFLEGMLYNVPNDLFAGTRQQVFASTLSWLLAANNRADWTTASRQHYLVRDGHSVCWPAANCTAFLDAALAAWNGW